MIYKIGNIDLSTRQTIGLKWTDNFLLEDTRSPANVVTVELGYLWKMYGFWLDWLCPEDRINVLRNKWVMVQRNIYSRKTNWIYKITDKVEEIKREMERGLCLGYLKFKAVI